MKTLSEFEKQKNFLVCIDSDGCVMNTMDAKHIRCFGPHMIAEWQLEQWEREILERWNEINLYSPTRGINRFKGLALCLSEVDRKYRKIDGIEPLVHWTKTANELSNGSLQKETEKHPSTEIFRKALRWSVSVNEAIKQLPEGLKSPFDGAKDALSYAQSQADVAVVSSANTDAVSEEWTKHGLLEYVDIVLTQSNGSKASCIAELKKKGYDTEKILMCGDAVGDLEAAEANGVYYYPILVRKEKESWQEFISVGLNKWLDGNYEGYGKEKRADFLKNLGADNL